MFLWPFHQIPENPAKLVCFLGLWHWAGQIITACFSFSFQTWKFLPSLQKQVNCCWVRYYDKTKVVLNLHPTSEEHYPCIRVGFLQKARVRKAQSTNERPTIKSYFKNVWENLSLPIPAFCYVAISSYVLWFSLLQLLKYSSVELYCFLEKEFPVAAKE